MSSRFTLAVESILRSLDRKDGLELPPSTVSLDFLNDAVVFGDNGIVSEEKIDASRKSEMSPYAHNFCYALELHGVKTVDEALEIFEKFTTMREDETPEKFIERCKNGGDVIIAVSNSKNCFTVAVKKTWPLALDENEATEIVLQIAVKGLVDEIKKLD